MEHFERTVLRWITRKLELAFWTVWGTNQAKMEGILIFPKLSLQQKSNLPRSSEQNSQELNQRLHRDFRPTSLICQTFNWQNVILQWLRNKAVQLFHAGPMPDYRNSIFRNPASQPARCRFNSIDSVSVRWKTMMCKVWWSQVEEQRKATSSNFGPISIHGAFRTNSFAVDHSKTRVSLLDSLGE